jgi:hypothetical protein
MERGLWASSAAVIALARVAWKKWKMGQLHNRAAPLKISLYGSAARRNRHAWGRGGAGPRMPFSSRDNAAARAYFPVMSSVAEIIEAVKQLDERQKGEFLEKLAEIDFEDAWDRQIETDAKAGRLDRFIEEAIREHREGNSSSFP